METGLGRYIKERREELGLTQDELATRIGTSRAYMSQIESGRAKWPQSLIPGLARALNVTQVELAVVAGLITETKVSRDDPFAPGDVRRKILAMLPELRDDDAEFVRIVVETAVERRRSIAGEQVTPEARETAEAGAVGMAQWEMRLLPVDADEEEPVAVIV